MLIGEFDNLSMYISHGIPDIPLSVSLFKYRWKDTISNFKKYLYRYPHLAALFDVDDPIRGHKVLEAFLNLSASCPQRSHFKLEPFYIEDGQIIKGYKAPDVDLPFDDSKPPNIDPTDDDLELPF